MEKFLSTVYPNPMLLMICCSSIQLMTNLVFSDKELMISEAL